MESKTKVELLAPAGNAAAFYGAVKAGADAVYLAGNRFGARAYAENFTSESLVECIRYAHLLGRRVYLAVNTLFKEHELAELYDYLAPFYEAGLDGVIVQDLGVFRYIREHFSGLKLHASTQMTLCSGYGAAVLKEMGASRIVPARELSLEELIAIRRHNDIEIEVFIHGAMCYCYSGQCLFSSILGGRSGNRGRCAQPCRLPYSVTAGSKGSGECYPLSLKDMCTIEHIPGLIEAGIDSFKIEGRMKKPEYAAGVTAVYRKYIDLYYQLRQKMSPEEAAAVYRVEKEDLRQLSALYIRCELQDGYYFKRNGREMVTLDSPAYSGSDEAMLAEIASKYLDAPLKQPVNVSARFQTGEPASVSLRLREPSLSIQVTGAVVEPAKNQPITEENIKKQLGKLGDSCFTAENIQVSVSEDGFYSLKQINELRREAAARLEQLILEKRGYGDRVTAPNNGQDVNRNRNQDTDKALNAVPDNNLPLNENSERCREYSGTPADGQEWAVSLQTIEQLCEIESWVCKPYNEALSHNEAVPKNAAMLHRQNICRIYVDGDLLLQSREKTLEICGRLVQYCSLWVTLPYIFRAQDIPYMEQVCDIMLRTGYFQGFLVRSMDEIGFLEERGAAGTGFRYRADACLYTWNREALRELSALGAVGFCMPYELKGGEQRALLRHMEEEPSMEEDLFMKENLHMKEMFFAEKIVYSRIPMMITANCVLRTTDKCKKDSKEILSLTDRYRKNFPVVRNCLHCMNIIYNSVPYSLHQDQAKWKGLSKRLDFTLETDSEMRAVLKAFLNGEIFPLREYTTGHEKRGVE